MKTEEIIAKITDILTEFAIDLHEQQGEDEVEEIIGWIEDELEKEILPDVRFRLESHFNDIIADYYEPMEEYEEV